MPGVGIQFNYGIKCVMFLQFVLSDIFIAVTIWSTVVKWDSFYGADIWIGEFWDQTHELTAPVIVKSESSIVTYNVSSKILIEFWHLRGFWPLPVISFQLSAKSVWLQNTSSSQPHSIRQSQRSVSGGHV